MLVYDLYSFFHDTNIDKICGKFSIYSMNTEATCSTLVFKHLFFYDENMFNKDWIEKGLDKLSLFQTVYINC